MSSPLTHRKAKAKPELHGKMLSPAVKRLKKEKAQHKAAGHVVRSAGAVKGLFRRTAGRPWSKPDVPGS